MAFNARFSLLCAAAVLFSTCCSAICPAPEMARLAKLDRYTAARFDVSQVQRIAVAQANDQCFWKVDYVLLPSRRPITLFLSPDGKYATPVLFDLSVDFAKEKAEKQAIAKKLLAANNSSDPRIPAKTTMVIFSDYECPFCQKLAVMMQEPAVAEQLKDVNVQLRNYPLSMHPWAKKAALAAACVHRQDPAGDADYANAIFSAQRDMHTDNVDARIQEIASSVPGVDKERLALCLANQESAPDVEADTRLANLVGVEGTPTVFIDGVRQQPFRTPDQIIEAIANAQTSARRLNATQ